MLPPQPRLLRIFTLLCCILATSTTYAVPQDDGSLVARITDMLARQNQQGVTAPVTLHIRILTPGARLANLCPQPELRLSGYPTHLTGHRSIIAHCGSRQTFIQIYINATGTYWLATRMLSPGKVIGSDDIQLHRGELDKLPADTLFAQQKITDAIATRTILPGQPITENQIRQRWIILAGNEVKIVVPGNGFLIRGKGKALANAALNNRLRVQTHSGQILDAIASGNGEATVSLKE